MCDPKLNLERKLQQKQPGLKILVQHSEKKEAHIGKEEKKKASLYNMTINV